MDDSLKDGELPSDATVLAAAREYVKLGLELQEAICARLAMPKPAAWRAHEAPKEGRIGESTYSFHGSGCRFAMRDGTCVDIEFRADGRFDGSFDAWRLWWFLESRGSRISREDLSAHLRRLDEGGALTRDTESREKAWYQLVSANSAERIEGEPTRSR